jgi:hypothetical protein
MLEVRGALHQLQVQLVPVDGMAAAEVALVMVLVGLAAAVVAHQMSEQLLGISIQD